MTSSTIFLPPLFACLALCTACDREHMSDNHGRQSREFYARQHVYADAAKGSPRGLDSEEAALIQESYRQSLGAEPRSGGTPPEASKVLMLQDDDDHSATK